MAGSPLGPRRWQIVEDFRRIDAIHFEGVERVLFFVKPSF
jgi:hypothetical protein